MTYYSQRDPRWKSIKLGFSDTTIGGYGCTITCLAMIIGTTPDVVNERLKAVQGYAEGNLVVWAKIEEAFPGIKIKRVWSYDNEDVKANVPNVLVEVDGKPIGGFRHWVVYLGNQKMADPWDGTEKTTTSYPNPVSYCVIGGTWKKPSPVGDNQADLDSCRLSRDTHWNHLNKIKDALGVQGEYSIDNILNRIDSLSKSEMTLGDKDKQLTQVQNELGTISNQLKTKIEEYTQLKQDHDDMGKQIDELGISLNEANHTIEKLQSQASPEELTGWNLIVRGIVKIFVKK